MKRWAMGVDLGGTKIEVAAQINMELFSTECEPKQMITAIININALAPKESMTSAGMVSISMRDRSPRPVVTPPFPDGRFAAPPAG